MPLTPSDEPGRRALRRAWEDAAPDWIAWARTPGHDSYWRFHRDAFLPLVPTPDGLTLDVGCGEGRVSRDLRRLGHTVVGIDASPAMVTSAVSHPEGDAPVVVGDAGALPVADGVADCVVAFMSLQDVDAMEEAVAEISRVLRRGGYLVMAITHPANTAGTFINRAGGGDDRDDGDRDDGDRDDGDRDDGDRDDGDRDDGDRDDGDRGDGARGDGRRGEDDLVFVLERSWFERVALSDTCERDGLTMTFHSEHRPLHDYTDALADAGFLIERLREVGDSNPADKWHRVPLFLHLRAIRTG